jgi:hypothetical protein
MIVPIIKSKTMIVPNIDLPKNSLSEATFVSDKTGSTRTFVSKTLVFRNIFVHITFGLMKHLF